MSFNLLASAWVTNVGWLLLHSVVQFTLVAVVASMAMSLIRRSAASMRYWVLLAAIGMMLAGPAVTWWWLPTNLAEVVVKVEGRPSVPPLEVKGLDGIEIGEGTALPTHDAPNLAATGLPVDTPPQAASAIASESDFASTQLASTSRPALKRLAASLEPMLPVIVASWMLGVILFSFRPLFGWYIVRRLKRKGASLVPENVQRSFDALVKRMRVSAAVKVMQSTLVKMPIVVGYFKPIVLLPVSVLTQLPISQLEAILAHELAHVRRLDYLVNLLQTLIETVFFYHPAVWWLSNQLRVEREHCCDDLVVAALDNRSEYGRALLAITELVGKENVLAVGIGGSSLLDRVRRLCGVEPAQRSWVGVLGCLMVLAIGVGASAFMPQLDDRDQQVTQLKLLRHDGKQISQKIHIGVPIIGFPDGTQLPRELITDENGVVELRDFDRGSWPMIVYWHNQGNPTRFQIELPSKSNLITQRLTPRSASRPARPAPQTPPNVKLTVRENGPRSSIYIEVTNRGSQPLTLGDLHLADGKWRIFAPEAMPIGNAEIKPGESRGFSLDWNTFVTDGLWVSRSFEIIREPVLPDGRDKSHQFYRLYLGDVIFGLVELKTPHRVLEEIAARRMATVEVLLERKMYFIGEHIPLRYRITNRADIPVSIDWGGDSRAPRALRFKIIAKGANGRVEDPFPNPNCFGGMGMSPTIEPGEHHDMQAIGLTTYCNFTKPGKYRLQVYHDLGWELVDHWDSLMTNELPKKGHLAPVAETTLELRMPTEQDASHIISALRKNFTDDYLANARCSGLRIDVYLPALRRWIDDNGGIIDSPSARRHEELFGVSAMVGIGSISTPKATIALIELLKHKNERVASEALKQLLGRLPFPFLAERQRWLGQREIIQRMAARSWRREFRQPLLDYALSILPTGFPPETDAASKPRETARQNQIRAARMLQAVAKQDDYLKLRSHVDQVIRAYHDLPDEQQRYPRPPTLTDEFIQALWFSFCNGELQYHSAQPKQRDFVFSTEDLDRLFAENEIDVFTAARLLNDVDNFRPKSWRDWAKKQLASDVPWVRAYTLANLPQPLDPQLRSAVVANIGNRYGESAAVQAEALKLAKEFPSAEFVDACREAVKTGDQWIKPMAEAALKACLDVDVLQQTQSDNGKGNR
jgi:beta-lactamase regulating signal transducer with metallopeptidase domain